MVSTAPSKALATLEHDTSALISSGMVTLNAKLTGIDDDKLVSRVVEIWGFFWDQVLPYVEGVSRWPHQHSTAPLIYTFRFCYHYKPIHSSRLSIEGINRTGHQMQQDKAPTPRSPHTSYPRHKLTSGRWRFARSGIRSFIRYSPG